MKTHLIRFLAACLALAAARAETPKLVVAILVDQLRYDYLERFADQFGPGGFRLFLDHGASMVFARYNYWPTVTGPGHASFLSGSPPSVHGIIGNSWFDRQTGRMRYCAEDSSVSGVGASSGDGKRSPRNYIGSNLADQMRLHFHSKVVGLSMKDRGAILPAGKKPTGAYWFDSKSGDFITSTYYMPELPAWVREFNERKRPAAFVGKAWDRLLDARFYDNPDDAAGEAALAGETTVTFPHKVAASRGGGFDPFVSTPYGNQILEELAEAAIEGEHLGKGPQPDLLCVSFSSIDYCGHRFGPYSQEVQDMTLRLDRQLADFFKFLDRRVGLGRVEILLTADHGVAPTPEYAAAAGLDSQRVGESALMQDLMAAVEARFGPGDYFQIREMVEGNVYFKRETLRQKSLTPNAVFEVIRDWALASGKFQACFSREQLLEGRAPGLLGELTANGYNAERSGDAVLILKPFLVPSGSPTGTTHGSPYNYDTHVPVLFFGAAFKPGRYAQEFWITDIAPTLCAALRIEEPAGCTGKPFTPLLANP